MPTGNVALDTSRYVKISNGKESLILQSHRDTVRIAVSESQPDIENTAFHEIGGAGAGGRQNMLPLSYTSQAVWALATTGNCRISVTTENTTTREYVTLSQPRMLTTGLTQAEIATIEGDRFSYVTRISNVDIATEVYILIENPVDSGVNVGFQERMFNTIVGGATFQVLWDYDVSTATKTTIDTFNQNNLFRGFKNGLLEISILNGVTESQGNYTVTGPATIIDEGVQREITQVPTSGVGANTSGNISPAIGFRVYGQGTGALIKITSAVDNNIVINGYDWIEAPATL